MEKVEHLIGKIKIRSNELVAENKRLKEEKLHLNQLYQEMKNDLEEKNDHVSKLEDKIKELEDELNTSGAAPVSGNKEMKSEIDGILKEIDQCLALINNN